jgi:uncharacterized protein involved in type VI secretion and phage assembly
MQQCKGVAQGLVRSLEDPLNEGRVQVEFPWLPNEADWPWAPVAVPLSGGSRGMQFMPEAGDEVLVAFEQGDCDHPFVVGFLWNGGAPPPETGTTTNRVILTPGGHTLRFEDGGSTAEGSSSDANNDEKKMVLRTNGGHEVHLNDDSADRNISITSIGGHEIKLDDSGSKISVVSNGGLSMTLDDTASSIKLEGGGRSLTLASGKVTIG